MLPRRRHKNGCLWHAETFVPQQALDFPLTGAVNVRFHEEESYRKNAENACRGDKVEISLHRRGSGIGEIEIREGARGD